ncbi:type I 3-dehydroquinate dehydratase [Arcanobacterium haemolyticum]|nr:type I 3-dehydroquinate dehydratase [Arcanobacterium haemolyticum]
MSQNISAVKLASFGDVRLGDGHTKFVVPLTPSTRDEALNQAQTAAESDTDLVEWRVDYLDSAPELSACSHVAALLTTRVHHPLIATFRTAAEGGEKEISDDAYHNLLVALSMTGSIAGIDVEIERTTYSKIVHTAHQAGVSVIASKHDFEGTPHGGTIVDTLARMADTGADVAKFAVMARTPIDVVHLAEATWEAADRLAIPVITMAMGPLGTLSRVAGGIFGSAATFATIAEASAPGQVPLTEAIPVVRAIEKWSGNAE